MANLVRIGETLINLDYVMSIEAGAANGDDRAHVAAVHMDRGRSVYFTGKQADAVRNLIRTFPDFPSDDPDGEAEPGIVESAGEGVVGTPPTWKRVSPE